MTDDDVIEIKAENRSFWTVTWDAESESVFMRGLMGDAQIKLIFPREEALALGDMLKAAAHGAQPEPWNDGAGE